MDLDVDGNSCIKQFIPLKPGRYLLEYDWAAKDGYPFETCKMSVYLNNKVVQFNTPVDYHIQHGRYVFVVDRLRTDPTELAFCAEGISDGYGAVINNVHVFSLDECQNK